MSPITGRDFQSELPLHPAAQEHLKSFFDQGWPDPSKLHHQSAQLRNLLGAASEVIAGHLGLKISELEFVGELGFGFQTAISGLLRGGYGAAPDSVFTFATIDRQIVHAFAREFAQVRGNDAATVELRPNRNGLVNYNDSPSNSVLSWQATNRETGVKQRPPTSGNYRTLFADLTAAAKLNSLPEKWDSALWDPRNFGGPQGIAIVGIAQNGDWRNPGPQIDKRRVFGSYSKPLLLATAVAMEHYVKEQSENLVKIKSLNELARKSLTDSIAHVQIAGALEDTDPRYLAFSIPGVIAEELLRKVESQGYLIDAGSACGGGALAPSHVLTAMGMPQDGNIRLTFKAEQSFESVIELIKGIAASA